MYCPPFYVSFVTSFMTIITHHMLPKFRPLDITTPYIEPKEGKEGKKVLTGLI